MTTLPDLGIYVASQFGEQQEEGVLSLSNVTLDCISRIDENQYRVFASTILDNETKYSISINLDETQFQEFIAKLGEPFPSVMEGIKEEYAELFEEPSSNSIPEYEISMRLQIRTQLQKGPFIDGNGKEFIPFKYNNIVITKVSEIVWRANNLNSF